MCSMPILVLLISVFDPVFKTVTPRSTRSLRACRELLVDRQVTLRCLQSVAGVAEVSEAVLGRLPCTIWSAVLGRPLSQLSIMFNLLQVVDHGRADIMVRHFREQFQGGRGDSSKLIFQLLEIALRPFLKKARQIREREP